MSIKVTEFNAATNETIEREATKAEQEQFDKDQAAFAEEKRQLLELENKKATAIEKLAALGLDVEDLRALGL